MVLLLILAGQSTGQKFVSEEASFAVAFPADPVQDTMTVPTLEGPQLRRVFRHADNEVVYFVVHTCMPPPRPPNDPRELLDLGRDGGLQMTGGKLVSERRLSLDGHPGRHLVEEVGGQRMYGRMFVGDNGAFYSVTASPRLKAARKQALAFLDSFKILPPSPRSVCKGGTQ